MTRGAVVTFRLESCQVSTSGGHNRLEIVMNDQELLRQYAVSGSQAAFARLVERHIGLVHSAARRRLRDDQLAEDVTQQVFTLLAQKGARLGEGTILSAWLYRAAGHFASATLRREGRRREREQLATVDMLPTADETWRQIEPLLEEAMARLAPAEQDTVALRFFENRSVKEVAAAQGVSEFAAQKRIGRAVEKLRAYFARRGRVTTTAALAAAITSGAIQPVPATLAATVAAAALASAGTAGASAGLIQTLFIMKTKLAISALTLAVALVPLAYQQRSLQRLQRENRALRDSAASPAPSRGEEPRAVTSNAAAADSERLRAEHLELLRLRGEVARLRREAAEAAGALNRKVTGETFAAEPAQPPTDPAEAQALRLRTESIQAGKFLGYCVRLYANDHEGALPRNLEQIAAEIRANINRDKDSFPVDLTAEMLARFEFVQPVPESIRQPEALLFRERVARRQPDGSWERDYTLVDGSVQTHLAPDGNFGWWEAQQQQRATLGSAAAK